MKKSFYWLDEFISYFQELEKDLMEQFKNTNMILNCFPFFETISWTSG